MRLLHSMQFLGSAARKGNRGKCTPCTCCQAVPLTCAHYLMIFPLAQWCRAMCARRAQVTDAMLCSRAAPLACRSRMRAAFARAVALVRGPHEAAMLLQVVGNWTDAIFALMELLPGHPSLPQLHAHAVLGGRRVNPGAGRTLDSKSGGRSPLGPAGHGGAGSGGGAGAAAHASAKGTLLGLTENPRGTPWALGGLAAVSFVAGVVASRTPLCSGLLRVGRRRRLPG